MTTLHLPVYVLIAFHLDDYLVSSQAGNKMGTAEMTVTKTGARPGSFWFSKRGPYEILYYTRLLHRCNVTSV